MAKGKKSVSLTDYATKNRPKVDLARQQEADKKSYSTLGISLYTAELELVEDLTKALRKAGTRKASRSLVIREALIRLGKQLKGKSPKEIRADFLQHEAERVRENHSSDN